MSDKRIEDMLRESWDTQEPEGMKERVLRRSRQELPRHTGRRGLRVLGWRPLLAGTAVVFMLLANLADHATQTRIARMTDGQSHGIAVPHTPGGFLARQKQIEQMLAQAPADGDACRQKNGDDLP